MWAFPRGEIILVVLEMPGTSQKPKWAANHQISQKLARINKKQNETQTFPTHSHYGQRFFLEGNEGNLEEIGGRTQSWENLQKRAAILWAFPRGDYSRGIRDAWYPSKTKVGS